MSQHDLEQGGLSPFSLLTSDDTARMDEASGEQIEVLMENAGRACADVFCKHVPPEKNVLIVSGPGNNGGDGYVMARSLKERGYDVAVTPWRPAKTVLAQKAASRWTGKTIPFSPERAAQYDWVVDAVFGAGFRPDKNLPADISDFMALAKKRMAIDMPSGISSDTGALCGDIAAYDLTVSFIRRRPGHVLRPGREKCGHVEVRDIGMKPEALEAAQPKIFYNQPGLWRLPLQRQDNDYSKYSRGVVSIIGGGAMPGAACLAADGARRSGAGLVRISVSKEKFLPFFLGNPGVIADIEKLETLVKDSRRQIWVCGPGLTVEEAGASFKTLIAAGKQIVADAGLLGWAAGNPSRLKGAAILTPHEGEFAKLFGTEGVFDLKPEKANRIEAAQAAARLTGSVVLLKGGETLIAHPDGCTAINIHASPALATAGSGDVLSGTIGTCLAAGMDVWAAACAGAWLHGEAGIRAAEKEGGWPLAEDIARALGHARCQAEMIQKTFFQENV